MLSYLLRGFSRQTLKSIQSNNYVKRFYTNQEFAQQNTDPCDDNHTSHGSGCDTQHRYHWFQELNEFTKLYDDYYKKWYDNFTNNSTANSGQQTHSHDDHKYHKTHEECHSNHYSFSECKYHLMTKRWLETIGCIGATIVLGLHVPRSFHTRRPSITSACTNTYEPLDTNVLNDEKCWKTCGKCKYCNALLSKLFVLSAPIRHSYIFNKTTTTDTKLHVFNEELTEKNSDSCPETHTKSIGFAINAKSDPIDDICKELQNASVQYVDRLNHLLGLSLVETDPDEAMKCWSSAKSNPKTLFNMGVAYESGRYSTKGTVDLERAHQHYMLAASLGHKQAIYNLSLFYLYGKGGIAVDLNRAETLLRRAATLGVKKAEQYIQELEVRRRAQTKQTNLMRSSASAPNLTQYDTYFEAFNNYDSNNRSNTRYLQTFAIVNRG